MTLRKWLLPAILLCLVAAYGGPLLLTYIANREGDECAFGPVSNDQYRVYLKRAIELRAEMPGTFTRESEEAKRRFDELFEKLIGRQPSVYERLAASHALLRSFGAQYQNTSDAKPNPYESVAKAGGFVRFNYYLDVNRLGLFQPIMRRAWIAAVLTGPGDFYRGPAPTVAGDIRFVVNFPTLDPPLPALERAAEQCPLVPDQSLAELFSRRN